MGAKASLVQGPGPGSALFPSPTLENIQAAYEDKQEEVARELIQQACCVECSVGMPRIDGVRTVSVHSSRKKRRKKVQGATLLLSFIHRATQCAVSDEALLHVP